MPTQFFEGQNVKVRIGIYDGPSGWRQARITMPVYQVQFPDGTYGVFEANRIKDSKIVKDVTKQAASP